MYFYADWPEITTGEIAVIVSISMFGAAIGALLSGPLSDRYGRRPMILVAASTYALGAFIIAVSPSVSVLIIGRFVIGLSLGALDLVIQLYLSEMAPVEIRGMLVAIFILVINISQFLASIIGLMLQPDWRWMYGWIVFLAAAYWVGIYYMPESPRWLGKVCQTGEMMSVMKQIYKP